MFLIQQTLVSGILMNQTSDWLALTESDYADCQDDQKTTFCSCFNFCSGSVTWSSMKQETLGLSTFEDHYTIKSLAALLALSLQKLLEDYSYEHKESTEIFFDRKLTIAIVKNPSFQEHSTFMCNISLSDLCQLMEEQC